MHDKFKSLLKNLDTPTAPESLKTQIFVRIETQRNKEKNLSYAASSLVLILSFIGTIYSVINLNSSLKVSGLYSYLSLIYTDGWSMFSVFLKDFLALLIESIPVASLIFFFGISAICIWSFTKTIKTVSAFKGTFKNA